MSQPNMFGKPILWRDTIRDPRLGIVDARVVLFFLIFAFKLARWTFLLLVFSYVVFFIIERFGYRFPSALRTVRASFAGTSRPAMAKSFYRNPVDFGFEYLRPAKAGKKSPSPTQ